MAITQVKDRICNRFSQSESKLLDHISIDVYQQVCDRILFQVWNQVREQVKRQVWVLVQTNRNESC